MDTDGAIGVRELIAELKGVLCVFKAACGNEEMGTADFLGAFDYGITITGVMVGLSELFVCEVGGDVKEGKTFLHYFSELLYHKYDRTLNEKSKIGANLF